jgi:hypothetical protein
MTPFVRLMSELGSASRVVDPEKVSAIMTRTQLCERPSDGPRRHTTGLHLSTVSTSPVSGVLGAASLPRMTPEDVVKCLGGAARWSAFRAAGVSRHALAGSIAAGTLVRHGWGTYALPGAHPDVLAAVRLNGFLSHESAAAFWSLDVRRPPNRPRVVVPDDRRSSPPQRGGRMVGRERLAGTENP